MFDIKNVDIMVSTRYLIKNLNLTLNRGDKCAIIGEEGNGKSTLLKSLLGVCDYATVSGSINFNNCKVGYLKQNLRETGDTFVKSYLFKDEKDYYDKIKKNADRLSSGTKFTIKALMDTKWEISRGMRLSLSKAFRRGVSCGDVRDVIELEQDSSKIIWYMKR